MPVDDVVHNLERKPKDPPALGYQPGEEEGGGGIILLQHLWDM